MMMPPPRFTPSECRAALKIWTKTRRIASALSAAEQSGSDTTASVADLRYGFELIVAAQENLRRELSAPRNMLHDHGADRGRC